MHDMVMKLDDLGRPAWLALMVASFIVFWPLGLAVLAFLLWSGRMGHGWERGWGCSGRHGDRSRWQARFADKWERRNGGGFRSAYAPSGNRAFDEYREETLKRLEDEQREFREFLERLRLAKDRAEFDQFMTERKDRPADMDPDMDQKGDGREGEAPLPRT